ncbi:MAG: VOC family protein [Gemmatimonadetes bacterium]|nr:VOC family protein [Gemmatimonadota bacterium]
MAEQGKVIWHDLMTTDVEKSKDFYKKLLGWECNVTDMGEAGKYNMIRSGSTDLGGYMPLDEKSGLPSHWIAYVGVGDVDAAIKAAVKTGGKVGVEPMDMPGVGRFGVISGPEGAWISPFKHETAPADDAPEKMPPFNTFHWLELVSNDIDASLECYANVFGWKGLAMDMGEMGMYHVMQADGVNRAGMMAIPPDAQGPSQWVPYVGIEDVDDVTARVEKLGGTVYAPPADVPGVGRFSVVADATGATLGLLQPAPMG